MKAGFQACAFALVWAVLPARAESITVDRAVVRFLAPETGGVRRPRFIFERELAFEARLEALADPDRAALSSGAYRSRHITAAIDRHIAEVILASVHIEPEPSEAELATQVELAHRILSDRVGGEDALEAARQAEGIGERELNRLLLVKARASLYLDRMVTPMLRPSDAELANIQRTTRTPFGDQPFERVRTPLLRWYVGRKLNTALSSYLENARSRLVITVL
jgi:hypothetical protein